MGSKPVKRGRPRKIGDPTIRAKLLECFERGSPVRLACLAAGIAESAFYEWQASDQEFAEDIKKARGAYAQECLDNVRRSGANGSWQASMTWLERQFPDEFGRRDRIQTEVSGPGGGPIVLEVPPTASAEDIAKLLREVIERDGGTT